VALKTILKSNIMPSLKLSLLKAIKDSPDVYRKDQAESLCRELGYNWADNGTSRMRELVRAKLIENVKNEDGVLTGWIYTAVEVPIVGEIKDKKINLKQGMMFDMRQRY